MIQGVKWHQFNMTLKNKISMLGFCTKFWALQNECNLSAIEKWKNTCRIIVREEQQYLNSKMIDDVGTLWLHDLKWIRSSYQWIFKETFFLVPEEGHA